MNTLVRTFILIAMLVSSIFAMTPHASAQASSEAVAATHDLNALMAAGDRQAADAYFLALPPDVQEEVMWLSMPVASSETVTVKRVDPAPGTEAARAGCWSQFRERVWESILGADVYKINERIGWCYSGGIYGQSCESRAVGVGYPWALKQYHSKCAIVFGGPGSTSIKYETEASFEACLIGRGCYDTRTNWIALQGWDNGGFTWFSG